jgi:hypothetical protein
MEFPGFFVFARICCRCSYETVLKGQLGGDVGSVYQMLYWCVFLKLKGCAKYEIKDSVV